MRETLYDDQQVAIYRDGRRFWIRYDAGSHQVVLREDEISAAEAHQAMTGTDALMRVLFQLQKRLEGAGINPYVTNVEPRSD